MGRQPWDNKKPNKTDNDMISTEEDYELDAVVRYFNNKITRKQVTAVIHHLSGNMAPDGSIHNSHDREEVYAYIENALRQKS